MAEYLFQGKLDNSVHEITYDQICELYEDNKREEEEGRKVTASSYRGENFYDGKNDLQSFWEEVSYRDPKTAGYRIYYPHGVVIQQSARRNFYRGENYLYPESIPTLLRNLKKYDNQKDREFYRFVADMRVAEFKAFLRKFDHVKNWNYCDVLYDALAQHYGLETGWLDITNDFNVALFFATCCWKDGKWEPLSKEQIETKNPYGMIFHMPSNRMTMRWLFAINDFIQWTGKVVGKNEKGKNIVRQKDKPDVVTRKNLVYPLGFQPFMRCHMQSGFGIYMREPFPLQEDSEFEKLKFKQSEKLSRKVFELMDGGKKIYPHEGLNQVQFVIDEIKNMTEFSEDAFNEALYRNHYYRMEDRQQCLKDIENFEINGHKIKITTGHSWNLSSGRRKKIDAAYNDFSLEKDYGIQIIERKQVPGPSGMYEPWMLASSDDEPGIADFKVREHVECGDSIVTRYMMDGLATMMTAQLQDF